MTMTMRSFSSVLRRETPSRERESFAQVATGGPHGNIRMPRRDVGHERRYVFAFQPLAAVTVGSRSIFDIVSVTQPVHMRLPGPGWTHPTPNLQSRPSTADGSSNSHDQATMRFSPAGFCGMRAWRGPYCGSALDLELVARCTGRSAGLFPAGSLPTRSATISSCSRCDRSTGDIRQLRRGLGSTPYNGEL